MLYCSLWNLTLSLDRASRGVCLVGLWWRLGILWWLWTKTTMNPHPSSVLALSTPSQANGLALDPQYSILFNQSHANIFPDQLWIGQEFFIPKPIIRVLKNKEEAARSSDLRKLKMPQNNTLLPCTSPGRFYGNNLNDPFGTITSFNCPKRADFIFSFPQKTKW